MLWFKIRNYLVETKKKDLKNILRTWPPYFKLFNWDCVDMIVIFCIERSHVVWLGKASCWKNILHKDRFCRFSDSSVKYLLLWLWWCFLKPFCFLNQAKFWFRKKTSAPIMEGHTYYTLENSNFPSAKDRNKPVFLKKWKREPQRSAPVLQLVLLWAVVGRDIWNPSSPASNPSTILFI